MPIAPRSIRTPVPESLTPTSVISTCLPAMPTATTAAPSIAEPRRVTPVTDLSTTTPRRLLVIRSWSSATFVAPACASTPIGSSVAVMSVTMASSERLTRRPPAPSPVVTMPLIRGLACLTTATPKPPLPAVEMPVIGRSVLSPVTRTPLAPLRSALMPTRLGALVAAQHQPVGRRLADGDGLQLDRAGAVELEPGAVAQQRGAHHRAGAVDAEQHAGPVVRLDRGAEVAERGVGRVELAVAGDHDERAAGTDRQRLPGGRRRTS